MGDKERQKSNSHLPIPIKSSKNINISPTCASPQHAQRSSSLAPSPTSLSAAVGPELQLARVDSSITGSYSLPPARSLSPKRTTDSKLTRQGSGLLDAEVQDALYFGEQHLSIQRPPEAASEIGNKLDTEQANQELVTGSPRASGSTSIGALASRIPVIQPPSLTTLTYPPVKYLHVPVLKSLDHLLAQNWRSNVRSELVFANREMREFLEQPPANETRLYPQLSKVLHAVFTSGRGFTVCPQSYIYNPIPSEYQ